MKCQPSVLMLAVVAAGLNVSEAQSANHVASKALPVQADILVGADGWYEIDYQRLVDFDSRFAGAESSSFALTVDGESVPLRIEGGSTFTRGARIGFYGRAVTDSLYSDHQRYRLQLDRRAAARFAEVGINSSVAANDRAVSTLTVEPQRTYFIGAPGDDPWAAARVVRTGAVTADATESFRAYPAGDTVATLTMTLWGGVDNPRVAIDHHAVVLVNGYHVAQVSFGGLAAQDVIATFPSQLLNRGDNQVTLRLPPDSGEASDVVYLDGFRLSYQRSLQADPEPVIFAVDGRSRETALTVAGNAADLLVLRDRNGVLAQVSASGQGDGVNRFAFASRQGDRVILFDTSHARPGELVPPAQSSDPMPGDVAELLIIAPGEFVGALEPLIAVRRAQGISTRVVEVERIFAAYTGGRREPAAIQSALAFAHKRLKTRYVLLVGADHYDYNNRLAQGAISHIPTHYLATSASIRFAPSDALYGDIGLDGDFDLAIGRFPARTPAEAGVMVSNTLAYENYAQVASAGFVSDRGFRDSSVAMQDYLGVNWAVSRVDLETYASGALEQARTDLMQSFERGPALLAYHGHSSPTQWADGLLSLTQAGSMNAAAPTVVTQFGCWGTYFVDPAQPSLAQVLMANPGGIAALIGQSGLSFKFSEQAYAQALLPRMQTLRIGDAMLQTANELTTNGGFQDVTLGSMLFGDPTLRVRAP